MAQTLSRRFLTAEARIRFQTSPHGIQSEQSVTGSDVHQVLLLSPVSIIPPLLPIHALFQLSLTVLATDSVVTLHTEVYF